MGKLTLAAAPTFTAPVEILVAGQAEPVPVTMTFKHRTKSEIIEWEKGKSQRSDLQTFLDMVVGWELEDDAPFNETNAAVFLENYAGAAYDTYLTYVDELFKARRKN